VEVLASMIEAGLRLFDVKIEEPAGQASMLRQSGLSIAP